MSNSPKTNVEEKSTSISNFRSSSTIEAKVEVEASIKQDFQEEEEPEQSVKVEIKKRSKKIWKDESEQTSHTKFYKRPTRLAEFELTTRDEYLSVSESMSGSADTFNCVHGPEGKQYTKKGLLKRNIKKKLDTVPFAYLLIRLDEEARFDVVSQAMLFHLAAPDSLRGHGTVAKQYALAAAAPVLTQTIVRMCAVADVNRFKTFLEITLFLAFDTVDNCIELMKENIIETIFYRFNPYFPEKGLPHYDINPQDCQDMNVKLGESSNNMTTTLSLLLVLLKSTLKYLDENPGFKSRLLPAPDCYAQRCFIWAYRYECRARDHRHQRINLTVIAAIMNKVFGDRLLLFSSILMPDIMSLSVLTELPPRNDWLATVNFNTSQQDVQFKKTLIFFVVDLLKVFPYNKIVR